VQILGGIASTTHVDYHRQRIAKSLLDQFAEQIQAKYVPLLVNHDFGQQIGVNLAARVVGLDDGEYALLVVSGMFDDANEAAAFLAGSDNTVWRDYESVLDDLEETVPALLAAASEEAAENVVQPETIADQLELYLDSTEIAPDGSVYLIKRRIASVGSLDINIYPQDHDPPHFHVVSKQRGIDARFYIETLELYNMKHGEIRTKEIKQIQDFFQTNPEALQKLRDEYARLQGS
jgi:hypothetical protein